jgi:hypothetical protein
MSNKKNYSLIFEYVSKENKEVNLKLDLKFKSNLISNVAVGRNRTTTNRTVGSFKNLRGRRLQKRNKFSLSLRVSSFLFLKN